MADRAEVPWEGQCADAAYEFALCCASLAARNPYNSAAPLNRIINTLMTELWDRNFSQSEIRTAFQEAIENMPRYAAGEERRSSTSTALATADWRPCAPAKQCRSWTVKMMKALKIVGAAAVIIWMTWASKMLLDIHFIAVETCGLVTSKMADGAIHVPVACPDLRGNEAKREKSS